MRKKDERRAGRGKAEESQGASWSRFRVFSTETSANIIFGLFLGGISKYFLGRIDLDQPAHVEESGDVGTPARLLHVVGDDDDGVVLLQLVDELLDLDRGDGIERGTGLVIRMISGSTAIARAMQSRCCWPPERPRALV